MLYMYIYILSAIKYLAYIICTLWYRYNFVHDNVVQSRNKIIRFASLIALIMSDMGHFHLLFSNPA